MASVAATRATPPIAERGPAAVGDREPDRRRHDPAREERRDEQRPGDDEIASAAVEVELSVREPQDGEELAQGVAPDAPDPAAAPPIGRRIDVRA